MGRWVGKMWWGTLKGRQMKDVWQQCLIKPVHTGVRERESGGSGRKNPLGGQRCMVEIRKKMVQKGDSTKICTVNNNTFHPFPHADSCLYIIPQLLFILLYIVLYFDYIFIPYSIYTDVLRGGVVIWEATFQPEGPGPTRTCPTEVSLSRTLNPLKLWLHWSVAYFKLWANWWGG